MAGDELAAHVGAVRLRSPVMTASGTSGHGTELASYGALSELGAVVVKSLAVHSWPGSPAPRVHPAPAGSMLNSVGLQGPGAQAWIEHDLPALAECGATVVVSVWGRTPDEFAQAAGILFEAASRSRGTIVAMEVNVSCPNLGGHVFAHSASRTTDVVRAIVEAAGPSRMPLWVKLSPNVPDVREVAGAALQAGADGLTLVNTLAGMTVDVERLGPPLAGGVSGPALHPVALRAVHDCRRAFPEAGIVGVGGVSCGRDALELLLAGADAIQVGTAIFDDPRAPWKVQDEIGRWLARRGSTLGEVVGAALR